MDALLASPVAWAAAGALVAFVWQGAILGAVTALGLVLLQRSSARFRYQVACGSRRVCRTSCDGTIRFDPDRATVSAPGRRPFAISVDAPHVSTTILPTGASNQPSSPTTWRGRPSGQHPPPRCCFCLGGWRVVLLRLPRLDQRRAARREANCRRSSCSASAACIARRLSAALLDCFHPPVH